MKTHLQHWTGQYLTMSLINLLVLIMCLFILMTTVEGGICTTNVTLQKRCQLHKRESDKISCNGDMPFLLQNTDDVKRWKYEDNVARLRALVVCHLPWNSIDPNFLTRFPRLQRLSIINSEITNFSRNFPYHQSLMMLNLTRLRLNTVRADLFTMLKSLRILDLSYNRIKYLNQIVLKSFNNLQHLYLKGDHWDCMKDMKWILSTKNYSLSRKVLDINQMYCSDNKYQGKPVSSVMKFIKGLEADCPKSENGKACDCKLDNVVWKHSVSAYLVPLITVNCSGRGWTHLPISLPSNTTILLLNNNVIKDISPLIIDTIYRDISDLYLDYNHIENIDNLEGAEWLTKFRVLSIKGNNLIKMPTYAFDNAFQMNFHILNIYLGNNPWICDCFFTPSFKEFILKYRVIIKDIYDIRCANKDGDENSLKTIQNISLRKVCQEPKEWMSAVDLINVVLAVLLLLLLIHFIYSYCNYRKTGELPWIAMKIP